VSLLQFTTLARFIDHLRDRHSEDIFPLEIEERARFWWMHAVNDCPLCPKPGLGQLDLAVARDVARGDA
jgi:hypothetical protein